MTRENKLALIVGFGLVLTVGILISDHFSKAQNQEQSNLGGVVDPLRHDAIDHPDLIEYTAAKESRQHGQQERETGQALTHPGSFRYDDVDENDRRPTNARQIPQQNPVTTGTQTHKTFEFYHVRSLETLTAICNDFYNTRDFKLVQALAVYNGLENPDRLSEGMRLRIPHELNGRRVGGGSGTQMTLQPQSASLDPPTKPSSESNKTYTVRSGDTLSEIAQKEMGSARHWQRLYEFNRDVITNPDNVKEGTVLRIPQS